MIKYVVDLDIDYLETFLGYEGDKVLKITTKNQDTVHLIEKYAKEIALDCRTEFESSGAHKNSYALYMGVEDSSIYKLKRDRES